ncbi:MAG: hypothetical protein FP814_09725 [Desulfobacterium sp.]|nr:hypothetical protein [Desulfobacteraceae bacterium]MBA3036759.1 hypothetical protein [Desulfobacterium sp.]
MDLTGIGSIADLAKTIVEKILPPKLTGAEQAELQLKLQDLLESRERTVIDFQKAVIVAEMQQADNYTKRARPTMVYAGLVFIFMVHVAFPILSFISSQTLPALKLPEEFWWAWTGVCGIWVIGRSAEKRGVDGKLVEMITGKRGA